MLMIADGATSKLAMKMGYCTEPPRGICSRAFVEGGTHNTDYDGELLLAQWVSAAGHTEDFTSREVLLAEESVCYATDGACPTGNPTDMAN